MPRKKTTEEQAAYEAQQAERLVRQDGQGESAAVKELLSDGFLEMSNLDATSVALALQQILKGQNSLLADIKDQGIQIAKLREHMDNTDKRVAEMLDREQRGITEVLDKSSKLKATGEEHDKIVARGAKMYTDAIHQARARQASDKQRFEEQLKHMEKEQIISPGQWIQTREGPKLIPEEVRIKHKIWVLPPGLVTTVPKCVADVLRDRRRSEIETAQRKEMLGKQQEQSKLSEQWNNVQGSKAQGIPLA